MLGDSLLSRYTAKRALTKANEHISLWMISGK